MNSSSVMVRPLNSELWDQAVALVASAGLPVADLQAGKQNLLGAFVHHELVGTAGTELYGEVALVRSVAVAAAHRREGIGSALYAALEDHARKEGVVQLILLTETAADYFQSKGYQPVSRETLPDSIQSTAEFTGLCPVSAVAMKKLLM